MAEVLQGERRMRPRPHRAFVYGTLQRGQYNNYLLEDGKRGQATYLGRGETVDPWPLVLATKFELPFLLYERGTGKKVRGDVYELDDQMLEFLDDMEGHPNMYVRHDVPVRMLSRPDGEPINGEEQTMCCCYMFEKFRPEMLSLPFVTEYEMKDTVLKYTEDKKTDALEEVLRKEVWREDFIPPK